MVIQKISARKILASLGEYTIEAGIEFSDGTLSIASVPAGISAGKYEIAKVPGETAILEIAKINQICKDKDWTQESLDAQISSHGFGGNSTLAVSAAFYKSITQNLKPITFPKLMLLIFEGGEHGNKNITMQEFMVIENSVNDASESFSRIMHYLKQNQIETTVGAEGGFSPLNFNNEKCLEMLRRVFPNKQIAVDMADTFHQSPIPENVFSVEDPYDDESWEKWQELVARGSSLVVGDDLTTTNPERIKKAIELKAITGVVIKPNQIGTISKAKEAVRVAKEGGLKIIVSHRGQETDDTWIVDFALDVAADFVKFGGLDRGERIAKYNRLLELLPS
jgi:enolase